MNCPSDSQQPAAHGLSPERQLVTNMVSPVTAVVDRPSSSLISNDIILRGGFTVEDCRPDKYAQARQTQTYRFEMGAGLPSDISPRSGCAIDRNQERPFVS